MNDGKIYITISDKRGQGGGGGGSGNGEKPLRSHKVVPKEMQIYDASSQTVRESAFLQHEVFHIATQQASQFVNYSISNIGNFTGNYQAQRDVQAAVGVGSSLANIVMVGVYAGMATGNPVIGAFASMVALGSAVINYDRQERANSFVIKKQNREIEVMRDISGLNSLTNGGRV